MARIKAVTKRNKTEDLLKAGNIVLQAKKDNIKLKFISKYNNEIKPMSYKEIVELKEIDKEVSEKVK